MLAASMRVAVRRRLRRTRRAERAAGAADVLDHDIAGQDVVLMPSAAMRATMSLGPPAGNGTIILMSRARIVLRVRRAGNGERGERAQRL